MTSAHTPPPPHPDALHAWADGRLPADQAAEQTAQADAATHATVAAWRVQRQALQALHQDVLQAPVPAAMQNVVHRAAAPHLQARPLVRWTGIAASVVLAFGLGWMSRAQWPGADAPTPAMARSTVQREFVRAAGFAHAVYLPEKRHPVEVGAAEQVHLVQWLSKRLGRTLVVPNLGAEGFALVGGRLLPGTGSARAQFMFENAQGQRVTLYLGGVTPSSQRTELAETRFQLDTSPERQSFYWFDQDFGYALSGQIGQERLLALATLVYQQIP